MFAVRRKVDAVHSVTVVGVVMGAPYLSKAIEDSLPLIDETFKNFQVINPVLKEQVVGTINQGVGTHVTMKVSQSTPIVVWSGQTLRAEPKINKLKSNISLGDETGVVTVYAGNMSYKFPVVAGGSIADRTLLWRLRHAGGRL